MILVQTFSFISVIYFKIGHRVIKTYIMDDIIINNLGTNNYIILI